MHNSRTFFCSTNIMLEKVCQNLENMKNEKNMSELSVGECGRVRRLDVVGGMRRRFLDIGLVPGTRVECIGRSPLGDPSAYIVRGKTVAVRAHDAVGVLIE